MSIASGRAWLAASQGMGNIGALLLQNQELERERQRQAERDALQANELAYTRNRDAEADAMREAEFTSRTGMTRNGQSAAPSGTVYSGGTYAPSSSKSLIAFPGQFAAASTAPSAQTAPAALTNIGKIAGGWQKTGRSATERTADTELKQNSVEAEALSRDNPGFAALPWRQQMQTVANPTILGSFTARQQREATAATRAKTDADETRSVAEYKRLYPSLASFGDEEVLRRGYELATRHATSGGGVADARRLLPTANTQRNEAQQVADRLRRAVPTTSPAPPILATGATAEQRAAAQQATDSKHVADSTMAERAVQAAQGRADAYGRTYDSLATVLGLPAAPVSSTVPDALLETVATENPGWSDAQIATEAARLWRRGISQEPGRGGTPGGTKTPAQWVAEVRADPAFSGKTAREVAVEARRRAGR